jgi:hypothetical protein
VLTPWLMCVGAPGAQCGHRFGHENTAGRPTRLRYLPLLLTHTASFSPSFQGETTLTIVPILREAKRVEFNKYIIPLNARRGNIGALACRSRPYPYSCVDRSDCGPTQVLLCAVRVFYSRG